MSDTKQLLFLRLPDQVFIYFYEGKYLYKKVIKQTLKE